LSTSMVLVMGRPKEASRITAQALKALHPDRTLRVALVYLIIASKGPTLRFEEIWDFPDIMQNKKNFSSKWVLHTTLDYMERRHIVKIDRISRRNTRVTLLLKPHKVTSEYANQMLLLAAKAKLESTVKTIVSNIEAGKMSATETFQFVYGRFLDDENARLQALLMLLDVYREPPLWPYLWADLVHLLVVLPVIFQLQILKACLDAHPEPTSAALKDLGKTISRELTSLCPEYQRIWDRMSQSSAATANINTREQEIR